MSVQTGARHALRLRVGHKNPSGGPLIFSVGGPGDEESCNGPGSWFTPLLVGGMYVAGFLNDRDLGFTIFLMGGTLTWLKLNYNIKGE